METCLVLLLAIACGAHAASTYTTKYDNLDLTEILENDRLYRKYFDCLVDKGKCTPDGEELKENLPDALRTECSKCSEKQKAGAEVVLRHIIEKKPDDWKVLEALYDPEGIYKAKFKAEADKRGIKIE